MMTPIRRYNKIQLSSKVSKRILNKKEVYRPHQSLEQQYKRTILALCSHTQRTWTIQYNRTCIQKNEQLFSWIFSCLTLNKLENIKLEDASEQVSAFLVNQFLKRRFSKIFLYIFLSICLTHNCGPTFPWKLYFSYQMVSEKIYFVYFCVKV